MPERHAGLAVSKQFGNKKSKREFEEWQIYQQRM
jgi:hypothetical protein